MADGYLLSVGREDVVVVAVLGKSGVYQFRFGRRGGGKAVKLSVVVV